MASAVPDMDTIPLLTESAESPRDSGDGSQDGLLRPNISSFTAAEVDAFVRLAEFVAPNPRKLKRITTLYLLCRLLLPDEASGLTGDMRVEESWIKLRDKLLAWLILCEQWPMRMCWILQVLQDNQQLLGEDVIHEQSKLSLFQFYNECVNNVIFTTLKDEAFQRSKVYRQYVESYAVEWDADIFQIMLRKVDLTVSDIGDLRMTRLSNKLLSYSVSLSPGLIYIVQRIASCHVEASKMDAMKSDSFQSISLLNQTQIQAAEPIAWTKSLQSRKLNMDRTVENNTRNQKAEETLILEQSKGCFRDDMTGKDHVGYSEYARAIAQLVMFHLEAPCVFGLYAAWGTGKSFTMRKIETYIKACCISKRVGNCKQPALHHDLLREVKACAEDDEDMDILYRWLCCGCPLECTKLGLGLAGQLDKSNVLQRWKSRQETVGSLDMQVDIASAVLQALNVFSDLVIAMVSMVKNSVACCDTSSGSLTLLRNAWFTSPDDPTDVDYEFTWFNAWLFCGSENLWAGLVLKLHEAVEAHYGPSYSRAAFNATIIVAVVKLMFALLFFLIGFIITRTSDVGDMVIELEHVTEDYKQFIAAIGKKLAGISMAGVSGSVIVQQVLTLFKSPVTPSKSIQARASQSKFRDRLGYMDEIKSEIETLSGFLNSPESVPTFWDLLAPADRPMAQSFMRCMKRFFHRPRSVRKCRVILFIDDLDRCPPGKITEVLQALVLLSENTPFISFLAIDPRVVVNAIENDHNAFFREASISGYEYLDKIVQVPFAFPTLTNTEKASLFRGYLTGSGESLYVQYTDTDGDTVRYELSECKHKINALINKGSKAKFEVDHFRYEHGSLSDGEGESEFPFSMADSLVQQLMALSEKRKPPMSFVVG